MPHAGGPLKNRQPSTKKPSDVVLLVTPTYAIPFRAKYSADASHAGAVSNPAVEFHLEALQFLPSVQLDIVDGRGYRVLRLLQGPLEQGTHRVIWDGRNSRGLASASGVYYYLLESGVGRETGKFVFVR